jgi:cytoskeleton protein RodZ
MNLQELGSLLKQERERRGLSVREVMDATKISRRNLNALEDGEVKLLPHPVYLKGYVRNYARFVGLDPEPLGAVVDKQWDGDSGYIVQVPSSPASSMSLDAASTVSAHVQETSSPEPPAPDGHVEPHVSVAAEPVVQERTVESLLRSGKPADLVPSPRTRLWPWVVLLVVILAAAGVTYQCRRIQSEGQQAQQAAVPVVNATDVNATAVNATDVNATDVEANATAALPESEPLPVSLPASAPVPAATAVAPAMPAQGQPTVPAASVEVSRKAPAAPLAPAVEGRTPGMQELVVIAKPGEICWVEVSEGQRRKTFTIRDGDSRRFEFSKTAKVRLGNAGGVNFRLNGSPYSYEGQRGQTAALEIAPQ